jgi:DNA-binding response OmpR family regulator
LDLNLAGVDGLDLLNLIKHNDSNHPVIIYSGMDEDELILKYFLGRANAVVRKMPPLTSLLIEIRQHLHKSSSMGKAHA